MCPRDLLALGLAQRCKRAGVVRTRRPASSTRAARAVPPAASHAPLAAARIPDGVHDGGVRGQSCTHRDERWS